MADIFYTTGERLSLVRRSTADLLDQLDAAEHELAAIPELYPERARHEHWLARVGEWRDALAEELAKRDQRAAAGKAPATRSPRIDALTDLARTVRRVTDIRLVLDRLGWHPVREARNGECAGPCPFCGGHDRFVVFAPQNGPQRAWCRRCGWSGDAIQLLRDAGDRSFVEAVLELAMDAGLPIPKEIAQPNDDAPSSGFVPVRKAARL